MVLLLLVLLPLFATVSGVPVAGATPAKMVGTEALMMRKEHGTCERAVQANLRWGCDDETSNKVCCFNRHYAEHSGYFEGTSFLLSKEATAARAHGTPLTFYDSVTGAPLFIAPRGRSWDNFVEESMAHGWPSFRDEECVLDNVRVLPDGEAVSIHGTHLGHNLPDAQGNRYCINLVSVAGRPRGGGSATAAAAAGAAAGAAVVT